MHSNAYTRRACDILTSLRAKALGAAMRYTLQVSQHGPGEVGAEAVDVLRYERDGRGACALLKLMLEGTVT